MAHSTNFYLKYTNSDDPTPVYLQFTFGYTELKDGNKKHGRVRYYPGEMIRPENWRMATKRAATSSGTEKYLGKIRKYKKYTGHPEFNQRLDNIERDATDVYRRLLNDGKKPTPKMITAELDLKYGKTLFIVQESVVEYLEKYNSNTNYIPGPKGHMEPMKDNTKKVYRTLLKHLKEFISDTGNKIGFDSIDPSFFEEYLGWMINEKELKYSSAGKYIKTLKSVLRRGDKLGYNLSDRYLREGFATPREESTSIYLTNNEIQKIVDLDLSNDKELDIVRDWFVIGTRTALRYGDLKRLTKDNIINTDGGEVIAIITEKTPVEVYSPFTGVVKRIFEKYSYDIPRPKSNAHMNRCLKTIGRLAEINDFLSRDIDTDGNRATDKEGKPLRKFHHITTHTARRSCATNLYIAKHSLISIMKITGHQDIKQLKEYIKVDSLENANSLRNDPYFQNGNHLRKVN